MSLFDQPPTRGDLLAMEILRARLARLGSAQSGDADVQGAIKKSYEQSQAFFAAATGEGESWGMLV